MPQAGCAGPQRHAVFGAESDANPEGRTLTTAYFHRPEEVAEAAEAGLADVRTVAVEGPVWMIGQRLTEVLASPELTAVMLDMLRRIEHEPSIFGSSSHLLAIGRRP